MTTHLASPVTTSPAPPAAVHPDRFLDDLIRLRADALTMLGWITGCISYLCLILLIWPITGVYASGVAWLGAGALFAASTLAILGSRSIQRTARYGFTAGVHVAAGCGMVILAEPTGAYLFLLPIIFASVLFNR